MKHLPIIHVLVDLHQGWGRGLIRGVAAYAMQRGPWKLDYVPTSVSEKELKRVCRESDGVIATITHADAARTLTRTRTPVVSVSRIDARLPMVYQSDEQIGRAVVNHFVARGFRNLAFCGWPAHRLEAGRESGFVLATAEQGLVGQVYRARQTRPGRVTSRMALEHMAAWVGRLEKPVGIMAGNDERAFDLISACRLAEVEVPGQAAIVGVDNDELLCTLGPLGISSLAVPSQEIGYRAAKILAGLLRGGKPPGSSVVVPPLEVVARESSDVYAIPDTAVAACLRYLRDHVDQRVTVDELADFVGLSRRSLEYRFRDAVGHSPWQQIRRTQVEKAKRLLAETDLRMDEVARSSGFRDGRQLGATFKELEGERPSDYRLRHRGRYAGVLGNIERDAVQ